LGDSERAVRALSLLASVGAVVALFFAARKSVGAPAALWACAIMALASPQVTYGQEARGYALALLLSVLAAGAVLRLERRGPSVSRAAIVGSLVLPMMLTHYFAIGPAIAIGIYVVIALRGRVRLQALIALTA